MLVRSIAVLIILLGIAGLVLPIVPGAALIIAGTLLFFRNRSADIRAKLSEKTPASAAIIYSRLLPKLLMPHCKMIAIPRKIYLITLTAFCVIADLWYLYWRAAYTLDHAHFAFSATFWAFECYGVICWFVMIFTLSNPTDNASKPPLMNKTVDIFITSYKEEVEMVKQTMLGCTFITYPHTTYLLDDGCREELKEAAKDYNCVYLSREGHKGFKAGNLNNGISMSSGEFILTLDADHVPQPNIVDKLIGFFEDEKVAFVQTPHEFYNKESFQYKMNVNNFIFHEQSLFFRKIQPGKDRYNAAFYCGSSGMLRRKALEDIGLFPEETVTEDFHLSIRIHAKGWKSVYYNEPLAFGMAPLDVFDFMRQRLRWGQGTILVIKMELFKAISRLKLRQKICYFQTFFSYIDGYQLLLYYVVPTLYFFFLITPFVPQDIMKFTIYFLLYFLSTLLFFKGLAGIYGYNFFMWMMNVVRFPLFIISTFTVFNRRHRKFVVSTKKTTRMNPVTALPVQFGFIGLYLVTIIVAVANFGSYKTDFFIPNFLWMFFNLIVFFTTVLWVLQYGKQYRVERRKHYRFGIAIPSWVKEKEDLGILSDINREGAMFKTFNPYRMGELVTLNFKLYDRELSLKGAVVSVAESDERAEYPFSNSIFFSDISDNDKDLIARYCFLKVVPRMFYAPVQSEVRPDSGSPGHIVVKNKLKLAAGRKILFRLINGEGSKFFVTDAFSNKGFSVVHDEPIASGADMSVELWLPNSEKVIVPVKLGSSQRLKYNVSEVLETVFSFDKKLRAEGR